MKASPQEFCASLRDLTLSWFKVGTRKRAKRERAFISKDVRKSFTVNCETMNGVFSSHIFGFATFVSVNIGKKK